ncbi:tax1-binding protein 1 homolog B-like [Hypanus sabinus]|uniref:tax1-binding protein 1 homolog B-like n=1 Tax=Hypanus sabinus TaxID=79690 RepID=UPI0028C4E974|nr:tax1-binding protein 1 homolog B-like [Hypanus sabinus]
MNEESLAGTSSLYSSTFAQVIFVNIEKQYTTDVAVKCNYILTPRITPHKNDWIGIFKVGWSTARDYHTFVWAPLPKEAGQVERQQQVTFEAYYLPKDNNDFYQFCYVTQKGEIRGASTPFGFRLANSGTPDRLDSDSGQEMLVITTQVSRLFSQVRPPTPPPPVVRVLYSAPAGLSARLVLVPSTRTQTVPLPVQVLTQTPHKSGGFQPGVHTPAPANGMKRSLGAPYL